MGCILIGGEIKTHEKAILMLTDESHATSAIGVIRLQLHLDFISPF